MENCDKAVVEKLFQRYPRMHPLVLHRSLERAKSPGELFDFLEGFPQEMPIAWDHLGRRWITTDLLQSKSFYATERSQD